MSGNAKPIPNRVSVEEFARTIGVAAITVHRWVTVQEMPALRVDSPAGKPRTIRIEPATAAAWVLHREPIMFRDFPEGQRARIVDRLRDLTEIPA